MSYQLMVTAACIMLLLASHVQAASPKPTTTATTTVNVTGTIIIPPCTVNNDGALTVDFGAIPNNIPDGLNTKYQQIRDVPVTCTYYQGKPYVKLLTSGAVMGGSASDSCVGTNVDKFCIDFHQGAGAGTPMRIGNGSGGIGYEITAGLGNPGTANSTFQFTMVPYRQAGADYSTAGAFNASATMSITYQ